ncbi:hypothetical protein PTSG_08239 [Salpingoeca rosetta]|uniref:KxDL domain-containing protein n=1 Tax=Salpingoeca rosetta (strain ATCC 50818 / BSB-021) TaxID=946362 RepID=F2UIE5_SALR5|nr:uncharacterized protein PTSG_08239 [Salpingoeca rosetta]EGD76894.1 hypothetical protein PTSG_08239 [Salpingoeca rosetta]|eukprot:XP_004991265.1 hypothetical protein PTSG_08239 [Salpingoeca rosetta]
MADDRPTSSSSRSAQAATGGVDDDDDGDNRTTLIDALHGMVDNEQLQQHVLPKQQETLARLQQTTQTLVAQTQEADRKHIAVQHQYARYAHLISAAKDDLMIIFRTLRSLQRHLRETEPDAWEAATAAALERESEKHNSQSDGVQKEPVDEGDGDSGGHGSPLDTPAAVGEEEGMGATVGDGDHGGVSEEGDDRPALTGDHNDERETGTEAIDEGQQEQDRALRVTPAATDGQQQQASA